MDVRDVVHKQIIPRVLRRPYTPLHVACMHAAYLLDGQTHRHRQTNSQAQIVRQTGRERKRDTEGQRETEREIDRYRDAELQR